MIHKQSISMKYFTVNCGQFLYSLLLFFDKNMCTFLNLNFEFEIFASDATFIIWIGVL